MKRCDIFSTQNLPRSLPKATVRMNVTVEGPMVTCCVTESVLDRHGQGPQPQTATIKLKSFARKTGSHVPSRSKQTATMTTTATSTGQRSSTSQHVSGLTLAEPKRRPSRAASGTAQRPWPSGGHGTPEQSGRADQLAWAGRRLRHQQLWTLVPSLPLTVRVTLHRSLCRAQPRRPHL